MTPYFNQNCEIAHDIRKMEKVFGRKSSHPWKFKLYDPHPRKTFLSTYGSSTHMNTRTNGACNSWAWAFFSIDPDWPLCVAISAQVHRPAFLQVFVQWLFCPFFQVPILVRFNRCQALWSILTFKQQSSWIYHSAGTPLLVVSTLAYSELAMECPWSGKSRNFVA